MSGSLRAARNMLVLVASQVISWTLTLLVLVFLPRYVGEAGLGRLAESGSLITIFGVFVSLGTSLVLIKEIARDQKRTGELLLASLSLRIPLGIGMAALAVATAYVLGWPGQLRVLVFVYALGMILGGINDALASALQGQERMALRSIAGIVDKFLWSAITISLIFFSLHNSVGYRAPLWVIAAVGLFTGLVSLTINLTAFKSLIPTLRRPTRETILSMARAGFPLLGMSIFQTLYGQTDPVVLKIVTNDVTVGWYAAANRFVGTAYFLPTVIFAALLPPLSRAYKEKPEEFGALARRAFSLMMLCGVPLALVYLLLPDKLIALLYHGKFRQSIEPLRIAGGGLLILYAGDMLGTLVVACDRTNQILRASIIAACIGIPACFLGAWAGSRWWGNGATGALLSDVVVESYLVWAYWKILPPGTINRASLGIIGRYALAALPMAGLLLLLLRTPLGAAGKIGLLAAIPCIGLYVFMCWLLRCFQPQDIALLRQILARKTGTPQTQSAGFVPEEKTMVDVSPPFLIGEPEVGEDPALTRRA